MGLPIAFFFFFSAPEHIDSPDRYSVAHGGKHEIFLLARPLSAVHLWCASHRALVFDPSFLSAAASRLPSPPVPSTACAPSDELAAGGPAAEELAGPGPGWAGSGKRGVCGGGGSALPRKCPSVSNANRWRSLIAWWCTCWDVVAIWSTPVMA